MERYTIVALCILAFLACLGLRILNFTAIDEIRQFPDTKSYVKKASWPLLAWGNRLGPLGGVARWYLRGRPLTVPLLYKLAGNSPESIGRFQLFFYKTNEECVQASEKIRFRRHKISVSGLQ